MRIVIQHRSHYRYPTPAHLGRHLIRLRPANHAKAKIETYGLHVRQECQVRWQQDPCGNHVAHLTFPADQPTRELDLLVELAVDVQPVNPFDFFVDVACRQMPFAYPANVRQDLKPFLDDGAGKREGLGRLTDEFFETLPSKGNTVDTVVAINVAVNRRINYVIRDEIGVWTPEETLERGRGSCRDSAVLLVAALRSLGLAARFVSGYLVQLTDEGMIPGAPKGVARDVVDLHAWAEVYLPGAGWVGLDATSGLFCGEGHIPLAASAYPPAAAPIEGTSDVGADDVGFEMTVARLGHEARPTSPYTEEVWQDLLRAGDETDQALASAGVQLTLGGEPTFNARENFDAAEWNSDALGPTKYAHGLTLIDELRKRLSPGAAVISRQGKAYPGESLPRWALDLCGRVDKQPVWPDRTGEVRADASMAAARTVAEAIAQRLGLAASLQPVYEDPWCLIKDEAALPTEVDLLTTELDTAPERKRLARTLERGLRSPSGYILPLAHVGGRFISEQWEFRRGKLFLLPGDGPIGFRLPLRSLGPGLPSPDPVWDPVAVPRDPRRAEEADEAQPVLAVDRGAKVARAAGARPVRTALVVEPRDERLYVFLPPLESQETFFALLSELDAVRESTGIDLVLEGYGPPPGSLVYRFSVTPDPGVLEVNLPPTASAREHVALLETVFDAALHTGLHAEKYQLDGRQAGSGGGHHITLGGPTPLSSPFVTRPDLLASLLTFAQHHPSLSYMFTGLFVGPTSQAPRVDEARHDSLDELEIALLRAFEPRDDALSGPDGKSAPWLSDALFRHLLVDLSGNTHRTEICIDKLFDPQTPHGRQGLVELRAFEMPPHFRMAAAQALLARALIATFVRAPYRAPLVRWGQGLHDRFLLPYYMWRDFEDVVDHVRRHGVALPAAGYKPFVDLRCPLVGELRAGDGRVEVRNAIEPWNVLGEEVGASGTARYVDSSMERIEIRAIDLVPERHQVVINGYTLPMHPTGVAGQLVAGVRFKAWAPPHALQPHIGIHHPIRVDVVDTWTKRSLGAAAYHVWHPHGRGFAAPPLTRFEASARRAQRFTVESPLPSPVAPGVAPMQGPAPYTLDLRRLPIDRIPKEPEEDELAHAE